MQIQFLTGQAKESGWSVERFPTKNERNVHLFYLCPWITHSCSLSFYLGVNEVSSTNLELSRLEGTDSFALDSPWRRGLFSKSLRCWSCCMSMVTSGSDWTLLKIDGNNCARELYVSLMTTSIFTSPFNKEIALVMDGRFCPLPCRHKRATLITRSTSASWPWMSNVLSTRSSSLPSSRHLQAYDINVR